MLNDGQRQLLTLFVDGEADAAERRAVAELVRESPEARQFLHLLQQDADHLRALARATLPEEFSEAVLSAIRDRGLQRTRVILPMRRRMPAWTRLAVAASVLAALATAAYLLQREPWVKMHPTTLAGAPSVTPNRSKIDPDADHGLVAANPKNESSTSRRPGSGSGNDGTRTPVWTADDAKQYAQVALGMINPLQQTLDSLAQAGAEFAAWNAKEALLTERFRPGVSFKSFDVHLPPLEEIRNLDQEKLLRQLSEHGFQQADISCQESGKSLERFEAACRANGVRWIVDPEAALRRNKKLPAMYVIYMENMTPDRVLKILQALQAEDKKAEAKTKGDTQFNTVLLQPLEESWRKWLAEMLGVPAASLVSPKPSAKPPASVPESGKPLVPDTIKSLEKIGSGSQAASKGREPAALVLVNGPARTPAQMTKEVKQFVESRSGFQPDAVQIVFVLRPTKG